MEDLGAGLLRRRVRGVDVGTRFDGEREVMQPGRVEGELLLLERLPQAERAGADSWKAEVVDRLATLALDEERLLQSERTENRAVERERARKVATSQIDVSKPD